MRIRRLPPKAGDPWVHKYILDPDDVTTVQMPTGARILDVQVQGQNVCVWALACPANRPMPVRLRIVGTGPLHAFPDHEDWTYVSTVQLEGGALVFHIFVEKGIKLINS